MQSLKKPGCYGNLKKTNNLLKIVWHCLLINGNTSSFIHIYLDIVNVSGWITDTVCTKMLNIAAICIILDEINNSNTLPRRGKNADVSRRSISDADMNGRNTPPGIYTLGLFTFYYEQYTAKTLHNRYILMNRKAFCNNN